MKRFPHFKSICTYLEDVCFFASFHRVILIKPTPDNRKRIENASDIEEVYLKSLKKNVIIVHEDKPEIGDYHISTKNTQLQCFLDIFCNDGKIKMDVATIAGGEIRYKIADMMKNEADIFNFCNLPSSDQKFRVAYNIWKPFVFKR